MVIGKGTIDKSIIRMWGAGIPAPSVDHILEVVLTGEIPVGTPEMGYSASHLELRPTPDYLSKVGEIKSTIQAGYKILEAILQCASGEPDTSMEVLFQDGLVEELARSYMGSDHASLAKQSLEGCKRLGTCVYPLPLGEDLATRLFSTAIKSPSTLRKLEESGELKQFGLLYKLGDTSEDLKKRYDALIELQSTLQ